MNKYFCLVASTLFVLVLGGCASGPSEQENAAAQSQARQAEEAARQAKREQITLVQPKVKKARAESIQVTGSRITNVEEVEIISLSAIPDEDYPDQIIETSPRLYSPGFATQIFKQYQVNPTISTLSDPVSTFAMDIDSGAYTLAKTMLEQNALPSSAGIRIEEFINAFNYQKQQSDELFNIGAQLFPSPHRKGFEVLHLSVQTKQLSDAERLNNNLVLVADTSGSMASDNKMDLLKQAFITLVSQMDNQDQIAIVTYSDHAKVLLKPTLVKNKRAIFKKINKLEADGSTNAEAGIKLAYNVAEQMFAPGYNNRVILSSDGMANSGSTDPEEIVNQIKESKERGIFLTTVGVGASMYNDYLLEQLANLGNGHYLYFGDENDIQNAFVDKLYEQLDTVAKDAKVQVHFNPDTVSEYRLLGYENRDVADHEFLSETTDGGELGAGHQVNVIYEVKLKENYAQQSDFGKVSVAYKKPLGKQVRFIEKNMPMAIKSNDLRNAATDSQLAFAAAAFAEKLRQSYWAQSYTYMDVLNILNDLPAHYKQQGQIKELEALVFKASQLDNRQLPDHYSAVDFNFDRVPTLQ